MTNRKTTKRALLSSVLALILCFAMLLGSTWAWFTDTATTKVNTIKSGTLNVQLLDAQGNTIEGEKLDFLGLDDNGELANANLLWEPGVTFYTEGFQVKNEGNLALKYEIVVSDANATSEGTANLLNVIEFKIVNTLPDADTAWEDVEAYTFSETNVLKKDGYSNSFYVVAHMDEAAGNEYQNCTLSGVAITVYATQDTVENDSFDNQYDANATFPVLDTDVN